MLMRKARTVLGLRLGTGARRPDDTTSWVLGLVVLIGVAAVMGGLVWLAHLALQRFG
jgi:hypothetical protein